MHIYVVIPAYNEEKRIARALDNYLKLAKKFGKNLTITIISESTDRTNSIISAYSRKTKNIQLIESRQRLGKGGALLKAFRILCKKCGKSDIIGFVDADESVSAYEIERLLNTLVAEKLDGVIGSRYLKGSKVIGKIPVTRVMASRAYNAMVRVLFGLPYTDTQCAAKFFRAEALCHVLERIVLSHTTFDLDILHKLKLDKRKILETPITYTVVEGGIRPAIMTIFFTTIGLRLSYTRYWGLIPPKVRYGLYRFINKPR